jgi:hypothetical protein
MAKPKKPQDSAQKLVTSYENQREKDSSKHHHRLFCGDFDDTDSAYSKVILTTEQAKRRLASVGKHLKSKI